VSPTLKYRTVVTLESPLLKVFQEPAKDMKTELLVHPGYQSHHHLSRERGNFICESALDQIVKLFRENRARPSDVTSNGASVFHVSNICLSLENICCSS